MNVDPADPPSAELARQDQLQHLFIWNQWRGRKPLQIRNHCCPSRAETTQDELPENPGMKQDQIGFEVFGEIRRAVCTAKEVDPYRGVDQDHCTPFRVGSRRREAASTSGTFPRSAANRRRAASSTSAFSPSRTATDLVAAPVTRTASSRRSRSISSVVLMHRASHESYAGSTATRASPPGSVARLATPPTAVPEAPGPGEKTGGVAQASRQASRAGYDLGLEHLQANRGGAEAGGHDPGQAGDGFHDHAGAPEMNEDTVIRYRPASNDLPMITKCGNK